MKFKCVVINYLGNHTKIFFEKNSKANIMKIMNKLGACDYELHPNGVYAIFEPYDCVRIPCEIILDEADYEIESKDPSDFKNIRKNK